MFRWTSGLLLALAMTGAARADETPKPGLLAVFAHPDDETLASGILVRAVDAGVDVHVVYVTSGDAGKDRSGANLAGEALAARREDETRAALKALGITREAIFLKFPDGKVPTLEAEVLAKLSPILEELEPHVVLTFGSFGVTGHKDHVATGRITTSAFDRTGKGTHLVYTVVSRARAEKLKIEQFGIEWIADARVSEVIDCAAAAERKSAAMRCHVTQFPPPLLDQVGQWFKDLPYEEIIHARGPRGASPLTSILAAPR